MSDALLIRHCSPTLAGMKTGNLFSCAFTDIDAMRESIRRLNRRLVGKGLRIIPLRFRKGRTLVYVFRPARLCQDLQHNIACRLLTERGYAPETPSRCVQHLMRRLSECDEFPHEIGLFLGYPPEDVCGFIEHKDEGCKLVGTWKVYGDAASAQKLFAKYRKCTDVYCAQYAQGKSIERLTVAS